MKDLSFWKATEFRQFLLYTGVLVLKDVTPSRAHYTHFLKLSVSMRMLLDEDDVRRVGNVELSRRLLREFNDESGDLYGDYFAVYNIHGLLHLPEDVVHFGCSLNHINSFPFENYLQGVKKMVRNHLNPVSQVYTHLHTRTFERKKRGRVVSSTERDSCFLLENGDIAFVVSENSNGTFEAKVVKKCYLKDFFRDPIPSSWVNIFLLENVQTTCQWKILPSNFVAAKCLCVPRKSSFVVQALVHNPGTEYQ